MKSYLLPLVLAAASVLPLSAGSFSFQGMFSSDDNIQLFNVTLGANSVVTFHTFGYGGGTNAATTVILAGGFDPLLTWFFADGTQINFNDDDPACSHSLSHNGACLDSYATPFLTAGNYILALTESGNNSAGNLSDGFTQQGNGNFTCPQGFCDTFGNQNNGNWAVDILNADSAAIAGAPEPVTFLLTACGLALLGATKFRQRILRNFTRS